MAELYYYAWQLSQLPKQQSVAGQSEAHLN